MFIFTLWKDFWTAACNFPHSDISLIESWTVVSEQHQGCVFLLAHSNLCCIQIGHITKKCAVNFKGEEELHN